MTTSTNYRQQKAANEAIAKERAAYRDLMKRIKANQRKIETNLQKINETRAHTNAVLEQAEALLEKIENERIDRAAEADQARADSQVDILNAIRTNSIETFLQAKYTESEH